MRYKPNPDVMAMGLALHKLDLVMKNMHFSKTTAQAISYRGGLYLKDSKISEYKEESLTILRSTI